MSDTDLAEIINRRAADIAVGLALCKAGSENHLGRYMGDLLADDEFDDLGTIMQAIEDNDDGSVLLYLNAEVDRQRKHWDRTS